VKDGDDDEQRIERALFRYRLIADAIEAPASARGPLLRAVADEEHSGPGGRRVRVSLRTLERWVARYQSHKLAGLMRAPRRDKGAVRSIPTAALERVIELRREQPSRSTPTLIDLIERAGEVAPGALKRSTLDRHLDHRSASRRMLHVLSTKRHVRLSFERPLDFVVGDFHAGPWVRTDLGDIRRSELGAFIDHCTRFVPDSRYGMAEDLMAVRRGLRALCTAWGLPIRIYVDNGPGYQAGRFHFGCSELGIDLVHSKPYVSEGRGVIERFNRTVKEAFETEVRLRKEPPTLDELNAFWHAWLEERYHRREHSETGEPPRERWLRLLEKTTVRRADPVLLDELLRLHAKRTVHAKTCTVEIGAVRFVVDSSLRKRRVQVLFDPHDLSSVLVYFDGRRIQRALPQVAGETPVQAGPQAPPPPSVDYLELLRRDHERRRAGELSTIRFRPAHDVSAHLPLARLLDQLRACSGRALGDVERQLAAEALEALAPLEIAIADTALKTAVATLGHGLHASQYLAALREHVLAARKKGSPR
jgi:putative transposase